VKVCPLDGLEVDDLAAHTETAHKLTPEQIDAAMAAGREGLRREGEAAGGGGGRQGGRPIGWDLAA
jgi:phage FluMu protein gp41